MVFPCHDLEQSNSQDSSLNDSTASQCAPPGSAQTTEASQRNASWGAVTPSTSLSNYSRQEHPIATRQNDAISSMVDDEGILARKQSPFTGAHDRNQPKYQPLELHNDRNLAPKRMANGEIKFTGYSLPASPIESSPYGLSRNSSRTSRGSQIGEVRSIFPLLIGCVLISLDRYLINYALASRTPWSKYRMVGNHTTSMI